MILYYTVDNIRILVETGHLDPAPYIPLPDSEIKELGFVVLPLLFNALIVYILGL